MQRLIFDQFQHDQFDEIDIINQMFPTEASLTESKRSLKSQSRLDTTLEQLKTEIKVVDQELSRQVQNQKDMKDTKTSIAAVKQEIVKILHQLGTMRQKADNIILETENASIDIRKLDVASKNLKKSGLALKNLHMLNSVLQSLDQCLFQKDQKDQKDQKGFQKRFEQIAQQLTAIKQLLTEFAAYRDTDKIKEFETRAIKLETEAQEILIHEFKIYFQENKSDQVLSILGFVEQIHPKIASIVADLAIHSAIIECQQLKEFVLDKTIEMQVRGRLYWLKQKTRPLFPKHWNVENQVSERLVSCVAKQLGVLVNVWLFTSESESKDQDKNQKDQKDQKDQDETKDEIKVKLEKIIKCAQIVIQFEIDQSMNDMLSSAIMIRLGPVILDHEEKIMSKYINECKEKKKFEAESTDGILQIFKSNVLLAFRVKNLLFLSDMVKQQMRALTLYADVLQTFTKANGPCVSIVMAQALVSISNSARYCIDTLSKFKESLELKQLKTKIDQEEIDETIQRFQFLVNDTLLIISGWTVQLMIEPLNKQMKKMPWSAMTPTLSLDSEHSRYVTELASVIETNIDPIRALLIDHPQSSWTFVYTKWSRACIARFFEIICSFNHGISEQGIRQLLVDIHVLSELILGTNKESKESKISKIAADTIKSDCQRVEQWLKVLLSPHDSIVQAFKLLLPNGTKADLTRILQLARVPSKQAPVYLNAFEQLK